MTWTEVLDSGATKVVVESYGYVERSIFSSHFEPFRHKRKFIFDIVSCDDLYFLIHDWLYLDEPEDDLFFEERNGIIYLDDPILCAKA